MGKKKNVYSEELKQQVIEMKLTGNYTNQVIMEKFGIRSVTQIKVWMKWFREGEEYRLSQPIGKQYSFGKGPEDLSEIDQLKQKIKYLEVKNDILKKYQEIERSWYQRQSSNSSNH